MDKRINTRFLTALTLVMMLGLAALLIIPRLSRPGAQKLMQLVEMAEKEGDLKRALDHCREASGADPANPEIRLKLGDLMYKMSRQDPELIGKFMAQWEGVLEVNPAHKGALERLFNANLELTQVQPAARFYEQLAGRAEKLYQVDKSNGKAEAYRFAAVLGWWLAGGAVNERQVTDAIASLQAILAKAPKLADIALFVARAYLRLGQDRMVSNRAAALDYLEKAVKVMEDAAAADPLSAIARLRGGLIAMQMVEDDAPGGSPRKYRERGRALIEEANKIVKNDDPHYVEVRSSYADQLVGQAKREQGLQVLRDLCKERPADPWPRLRLAAYLRGDPATRQEALDLLTSMSMDPTAYEGFRAHLRFQVEHERLTSLVETQLAMLPSITDAAAREAMREQMDKNFEAASRLVPADDPSILELRGRKLLATKPGSLYEAISLIQKAHDISLQRGRIDLERAMILARAYISAGENGQAREMLTQIIARRPDLFEARRMRAELFASEGRGTEFRMEVAAMERLAPGDPEVLRYKIGTLDLVKDKDKVSELLAQLPVGTDAERLTKARIALMAGQNAMAEGLLAQLRDSEKFRVTAVSLLAQTYARTNRLPEAKRLVDEEQSKKPDPALRLLAARLQGSREDVESAFQEVLGGISDPAERELRAYRFARQQADSPEAVAKAADHLQQAAKLAPTNVRVLDALFDLYLEQNNHAEAERCLARLAQQNADQVSGEYYRFRLCLAQNKTADAVRIANELTRTQPEFSRSWLALGQAQMANRQPELARDSFNKVLERQPTNHLALRGLIDTSEALGQPEAMRQYIDRALRALPNDSYFRERSVRFEETHGSPERAVPERENAVNQQPDRMQNWLSLGECYVRAARARRSMDPTGAARYIEKARQVLSTAKTKWPDARPLYTHLAEVALEQGKPEDGLAVLKELTTRDAWKNRPEAYSGLGSFLAHIGRLAEAETVIGQAVDLSPNKAEARMALVRLHLMAGFTKEAAAKAAGVLEDVVAESKDPQKTKLLIEMYLRADRADAADKRLTELLARTPDDVELISLRGLWHLQRGETAQAEAVFNRAIKIDPNARAALQFRGRIRLATDRVNDAVADLETAKRIAPAEPETRMLLSQGYWRLARRTESLKEGEEALRLVPLSRDIRMHLVNRYVDADNTLRAQDLLVEAQRTAGLANEPVWYLRHSELLLRANNPQGALQKLQAARKLAPSSSELAIREADIHAAVRNPRAALAALEQVASNPDAQKDYRVPAIRAAARAALNEREAAVNDFDAALALAPDDGVARGILQRLHIALGDTNAIAMLERRAKEDSRWRILLAELYARIGNTPDAVAAIEAVIDVPAAFDKLTVPQKHAALQSAGRIYLQAGGGKADRGVQSYLRYIKLLDESPGGGDAFIRMIVLNNLASALTDFFQPPRAKEAQQYAAQAHGILMKLAQDPVSMDRARMASAQVLDTYGWTLVLGGQVDRAISLLSDARTRDPRMIEINYHLAEAFLISKRPDLAQGYLDAAMALVSERRGGGEVIEESLVQRIREATGRAAEMQKKKDAKEGGA